MVVCATTRDERKKRAMSERDGFEPGVPCWVDTWQPDADAAVRFYGAVFGWETEVFGPVTMWKRPGYVGGEPRQPAPRDVIAAMLPPAGEGVSAQWGVDFWIRDADQAAAQAKELGGEVITAPYDIPGI